MNINNIYSKNIQYFYKCAELRNFSDSAKALLVSQSTLSIAIKELERSLEMQLFVRGKGIKKIKLTDDGEKLFAIITSQNIDFNKKNNSKKVRLIKVATLSFIGEQYLMPALLKLDLIDKVNVFGSRMEKMLPTIKNHSMDIVFTYSKSAPSNNKKYCIKLQKAKLGIIGLRKKFKHIEKFTKLSQMTNEPFIAGDKIRAAWFSCIDDDKRGYYVEDFSFYKYLIMNGFGIGSAVIDMFTKEEKSLLSISKISIPQRGLALYAVINPGLSKDESMLCNQIVNQVKDLINEK